MTFGKARKLPRETKDWLFVETLLYVPSNLKFRWLALSSLANQAIEASRTGWVPSRLLGRWQLLLCVQELRRNCSAGFGLRQFSLNFISSGAELFYRTPHPSGKLGQLLRAEQKKHDKEDYHHVRARKIQDTGDCWSHKRVSLNGSLSFTHSTNLPSLYSPESERNLFSKEWNKSGRDESL
jgi:hypothetical protein